MADIGLFTAGEALACHSHFIWRLSSKNFAFISLVTSYGTVGNATVFALHRLARRERAHWFGILRLCPRALRR